MNKVSGSIEGWWFSGDNFRLGYGDGRKVGRFTEHTVRGTITLCRNGLHASENILDALQYADTFYVWRVKISGDVVIANDKFVGRKRKYLWGYNIRNEVIDTFTTVGSTKYKEDFLQHAITHPRDCRLILDTVPNYYSTFTSEPDYYSTFNSELEARVKENKPSWFKQRYI